MEARMEASEGRSAGMVGGRREEEEGFGGFGVIWSGVGLSGRRGGRARAPPYLGWISGVSVSPSI